MAVTTYTTVAGRIVHENRGGVQRFYGSDPLGSTSALYDTSGNKTDDYSYWPYGEIRSHTGSSQTPFTFVGTLGYYTDLAGQLYVRARYLATNLARWLTVDHLWPWENAYAYAGLQPTDKVDPRGFQGQLSALLNGKTILANTAISAAEVGSTRAVWMAATSSSDPMGALVAGYRAQIRGQRHVTEWPKDGAPVLIHLVWEKPTLLGRRTASTAAPRYIKTHSQMGAPLRRSCSPIARTIASKERLVGLA